LPFSRHQAAAISSVASASFAPIARTMQSSSNTGAKLESIAMMCSASFPQMTQSETRIALSDPSKRNPRPS
jgi:biotin carboxylase